jgi:hypothetical protein
MSSDEKRQTVSETEGQSEGNLDRRRQALGTFAKYTAPVLLATLLSQGQGMAGTCISCA